MPVDIECSHVDHASNSGYPGWVTVLGVVPDDATPPNGMICDGCRAAANEAAIETIDQAKARCIQECKDWRDLKMNTPVDQGGMSIEYPASSGKLWSISFVDQQHWDALCGAKDDLTYPISFRTWDEMDSYSFASAADIKAIYDIIRDTVLGEIGTCDAALANIADATDIASVETAAAAYARV